MIYLEAHTAAAGNAVDSGSFGMHFFEPRVHYHGANPATYANTLLTSGSIQALYWDDSDHLFATEWTADGNGKLYVFTVILTSASQAPGSPYAIPSPDSLNVRPARTQQSANPGRHEPLSRWSKSSKRGERNEARSLRPLPLTAGKRPPSWRTAEEPILRGWTRFRTPRPTTNHGRPKLYY